MKGSMVVDRRREALAMLGDLFEYPSEESPVIEERLRAAAVEADPNAAARLDDFAREVDRLDQAALEATYTSTFDLGASCLPYLGAHLFDPESRDRARLMVGLRIAYRDRGHDTGVELPDHIAHVLRFSPSFEEEEWADLLRFVLNPALEKMERALRGSANPYRHLIAAAAHLCLAAQEASGES